MYFCKKKGKKRVFKYKNNVYGVLEIILFFILINVFVLFCFDIVFFRVILYYSRFFIFRIDCFSVIWNFIELMLVLVYFFFMRNMRFEVWRGFFLFYRKKLNFFKKIVILIWLDWRRGIKRWLVVNINVKDSFNK